jgi:hypothetical protein
MVHFRLPCPSGAGVLLSLKNTPQGILLATAFKREDRLYLTQQDLFLERGTQRMPCRIRVNEYLDASWQEGLEGLQIMHEEVGTTPLWWSASSGVQVRRLLLFAPDERLLEVPKHQRRGEGTGAAHQKPRAAVAGQRGVRRSEAARRPQYPRSLL